MLTLTVRIQKENLSVNVNKDTRVTANKEEERPCHLRILESRMNAEVTRNRSGGQQ